VRYPRQPLGLSLQDWYDRLDNELNGILSENKTEKEKLVGRQEERKHHQETNLTPSQRSRNMGTTSQLKRKREREEEEGEEGEGCMKKQAVSQRDRLIPPLWDCCQNKKASDKKMATPHQIQKKPAKCEQGNIPIPHTPKKQIPTISNDRNFQNSSRTIAPPVPKRPSKSVFGKVSWTIMWRKRNLPQHSPIRPTSNSEPNQSHSNKPETNNNNNNNNEVKK